MRIHPLLATGLITLALSACSGSVATIEYDFDDSGTLVRNQEGLTPGVWYLQYDEGAMQDLTKRLSFDDDTVCITGETRGACERSVYQNGLPVTIRAMEEGEGLLVKEMEITQ